MNFDLRLPIGLMFGFFGLLLTIFGLVSDKAIYARSLGININLAWGLVLLAFGGWMLFLSRRSFCKSSDGGGCCCGGKPTDQKTAGEQPTKS